MIAAPVAPAPTGGADTCLRAALTVDGALALLVERSIADMVRPWLPAHVRLSATRTAQHASAASQSAASSAAQIVVRAVTPSTSANASVDQRRADLVAGDVHLWRDGDCLTMRAPSGDPRSSTCTGIVDLLGRAATIDVAAGASLVALHTMLLLASAYLLGRLGRALVHGASLVAPDGRAWLLVGDSHAGKTATCATLVEAGWQYCADDHAILQHAPNGDVVLEGWPRLFHLDRGWDDGTPAGGLRGDVDAFTRWPGRWRPMAPVAGLLCCRVDAAAPTTLEPLAAPTRLAALLRQSPWLTVDRPTAPTLLALLQHVAAHSGAALRLGRDSFRRPVLLAAVLAPLTGCA